MSDPCPLDRGEDTCPAPGSVADHGERWTCPRCGRAYVADPGDDDTNEKMFAWAIDLGAEQPDLPIPEWPPPVLPPEPEWLPAPEPSTHNDLTRYGPA